MRASSGLKLVCALPLCALILLSGRSVPGVRGASSNAGSTSAPGAASSRSTTSTGASSISGTGSTAGTSSSSSGGTQASSGTLNGSTTSSGAGTAATSTTSSGTSSSSTSSPGSASAASTSTSCSLGYTSVPGWWDVRDFGACCDWSLGTGQGTDDTVAFQAAAKAATANFRNTGAAIEVRIPNGCEITGSVTYGSGVHWRGPGSIIVLSEHTAPVLVAQNADDVSVEDLTVKILGHDTACAPTVNDARCVALSYETTNAESGVSHRKIRFTGNTVYDANWGILVQNQAGNDTVSDIHVDRNTVVSSIPYTNHDGIHVGGAVSLFTIANNNVFGRGDAAIAVSSEVNGSYICSGGTISGNTLLENLVGVDDSGCSDLVVTGNIARATLPVTNTSNPAFRSIFYGGVVPGDLTVSGNTFINYAGLGDDYAAKFDLIGSSTNLSNSTFSNNTISSLYARGSRITVQGNTFLDGARYSCDIDAGNNIASDSIMIGQNTWLGTGTLSCEGNSALITNDYLFKQMSVGNKLVLHVSSLIATQ